jgi:hypothetical protein
VPKRMVGKGTIAPPTVVWTSWPSPGADDLERLGNAFYRGGRGMNGAGGGGRSVCPRTSGFRPVGVGVKTEEDTMIEGA